MLWIYLCMGVSDYWQVSVLCVLRVCVCVCLISNQSTSKKHIICQASENLALCCIKHISMFFWYLGTKASNIQIHDDDDELFLWYCWPTKGVYALFPAGTIVTDSHHRKSPTRRKQGLNLRRIWSSDFVEGSCALVIKTTPRRHIIK